MSEGGTQAACARMTWLSVAALAIFTCAFFFPVLFLNQALFPSSVLAGDPLWRAGATTWHDPGNYLLSDQLTQFLPWRVLTAQALRHGDVPAWNPYDGIGEPLLGAMQPGVYYPLNLLVLPLGPARAPGIRAAISLFLAATGMLLFLRSLRLRHAAALVGALAFGYSLFNVVWAGYSMGTVVAWLPWLLLAVEWTLRSGSPGRVAALAAFWAISLLGGHIESSIHMGLLVCAYSFWRLIGMLRCHGVRPAILAAVKTACGLALGTGLAAVQLLPVLAYLPWTIAGATRGAVPGITPTALLGFPAQWLTLLITLLPDGFGNPTRTQYWVVFATTTYTEAACFFGVTATVLVLAAGRRTFSRPHARFFLAALIVSAGIAFQLPLLSLAAQIFPLSVTLNARLRLEYTFCAAALAAIVLHELASREDPAWMAGAMLRGIQRWALLAFLPVLILGAVALGLVAIPEIQQAIDARTFLPLIWLGTLAAASLALQRRRLDRRAFLTLLILVQAADLLITGFDFNPMVPVSHVAPVTPVITYLRTHIQGYRVVGVDAAVPNILSAFDIPDIAIYDVAAPATYRALLRRWTGRDLDADLRFTKQDLRALQLPLLDALGVTYLVAGEPLSLPAGGRWRHLRIGAVDLYQNLQALPLAHLVRRVRCLPSEPAVLVAVTSPAFRPAVEALAVCGTNTGRLPADRGDPAGGKVLRSTAHGMTGTDLEVESTGPAVLVLAQQYLPGWTVSAGRHSYPVFRCDSVLQCVALPGGKRALRIRYEAPGFRAGLAITAAGAALELLLLAAALHVHWRHAPGPRADGEER